ncbi:MAG: POTRA domain-containing protein, partial [Janthinobacterium lividum]
MRVIGSTRVKIVLGFLSSIHGLHALAATELDAAGRQADVIQQRQQQQIQQDRDEAQREIRPGGADLRSLVPTTPPPGDTPGKCHEIKSIEIADAHRLAGGVRQQINLQYAGKCLGVDEISQILALITKNYIEQGYVTTRAYLPAQNLQSGVLKIVVLEGRIGAFQIDD